MADQTFSISVPMAPLADMTPSSLPLSDKMHKLLREKKSAREFQERKHLDWNENYELYRNRVRTNRLTQRQSVNIPLMKETIKTLLSKIDDPPMVDWKELAGDQDKEIIFQALWDRDYENLNLEGVDIQDKKTVMLNGRGTKKLNWIDNGMDIHALDVFDVVYDPMMDPLDIESARFIIHQNIFRSLRDILVDNRYDKDARARLKNFMMSKEGIVQSASNRVEWEKKLERIKAMGVDSSQFPYFAGGDVIVNLSEHYTLVWNTSIAEFERHCVVYADDTVELLDEKLIDLIGVDFYPFVTWGDDVETQDLWPDSNADVVRVPNKILNIWFSQLVENRTLKNFQMHWYDATIQGYAPQTYEPGPGRMLPAPGDPNKTIMPVNIDNLQDLFGAIEFLTNIVERATAATAYEKGVSGQKNTTLGEVKLLVGSAIERTMTITKFYRRSWYELATKWAEMMYVNARGKQLLYKTSRNGKIFPKTVYPSDWKSTMGYKAVVRSTSEQEQEQTKGMQKFQFILQQFPNNPALARIAQKRMLELVDLTPEELREVEDAEKEAQKQQEAQQNAAQGQGGQPGQPAQPAQPGGGMAYAQSEAPALNQRTNLMAMRRMALANAKNLGGVAPPGIG